MNFLSISDFNACELTKDVEFHKKISTNSLIRQKRNLKDWHKHTNDEGVIKWSMLFMKTRKVLQSLRMPLVYVFCHFKAQTFTIPGF